MLSRFPVYPSDCGDAMIRRSLRKEARHGRWASFPVSMSFVEVWLYELLHKCY